MMKAFGVIGSARVTAVVGALLVAACGGAETSEDVAAESAPEPEQTLGADALVNRRSPTWRGLSDAEKASADGEGAVALMVEHPTLMKRPVIVTGGTVHVGWTKDVQTALL